MPRLVLDSLTEVSFINAKQAVAVCDHGGRFIGLFVPFVDGELPPGLRPTINSEEMDRRERVGGGRPLTEILSDLEKRT